MFTQAIVRKPFKEMIHGLSSASQGKPDYDLALCTPSYAILTNPGAASIKTWSIFRLREPWMQAM